MRQRNERGLTLVEVLMSVVIAGIIFPALTGVVIISLRTLDGTNKKLAGSNDTLLVASYFTSDVEGASALAVGGTHAHVTPAVTLPPGTTSTVLVLMYGLRGATTMVPAPTAGTVWNAAAGSLTSSAADELLTITDDNRNDTLARVATTTAATSSVAQTVALKTTGNVVRRGESHGAAANGASLPLAKPTGVVQNDVLVAHITAATSALKVAPPATTSGWVEVDRVELSPTLTSLAYVKTAGVTEPAGWTWGFTAGSGAHDIAGGIVAYTNISNATPVAAHASYANPCGGETPLFSIATADRVAVSSAAYFFETSGDENQLVRRSCTAEGGRATQVLARALQPTSGATAACAPTQCDPLPVTATLTLREPAVPHETVGRSYVLSARTRTG